MSLQATVHWIYRDHWADQEDATYNHLLGTYHETFGSEDLVETQIAWFLKNAVIVNGVNEKQIKGIRRSNKDAIIANGFSDLALMWAAFVKRKIGGIYAAGPNDNCHNFTSTYDCIIIYDCVMGLEIHLQVCDGEIFVGSLEEFLA